MWRLSALLLCIVCSLLVVSCIGQRQTTTATAPIGGNHTNNWAVIVCTSRFWFNYRHVANALSIYRNVKRLGIPDSQIILMIADDVACNPRNIHPAQVAFQQADGFNVDVYGENVEVDYRGYDVNVENFLRLLLDRHDENVPRSRRLLSDENSNILIYLSGHGGNEFLKFQDSEEITSSDLADAFDQLYQKRRYHELLFIVDTCQANTLYKRFYSPGIIAMGSSDKGQNSYSHNHDSRIGLSLVDRFTQTTLEFLEKIGPDSSKTLLDLFNTLSPKKLHSNPGVRTDLAHRSLSAVRVTDFFASVSRAEITTEAYPLLRRRSSTNNTSSIVDELSRSSDQ